MKHEKEIDALLREILYFEDLMDEEDYLLVVDEALKTAGITKQDLSNDIEVGLRNGYTLEEQLILLKKSLK